METTDQIAGAEAGGGEKSPGSGPSGVREFLRRALLLTGLCGALYGWFGFCADLWRVEICDFQARLEQERAGKSPWFRAEPRKAASQTLEQFIAQETEGRLTRRAGVSWEELLRTAQAAGQGSAWQERKGSNFLSGWFFFRADEAPLARLIEGLDPEVLAQYVLLESGGRLQYLQLVRVGSSDLHLAPVVVARPWRAYALPFLLLGFLGYLFLPWPSIQRGAVHYRRADLVTVDLVGAALGGFFFVLPLWILPGAGGSWLGAGPLDFGTGSAYFTLLFWGFTALCFRLHHYSAWHASLQIVLDAGAERLLVWTLYGGQKEIRFEEIEGVSEFASWGLRFRYHVWAMPRLQKQLGIQLRLRTGRRIRLLRAGLENARPWLERLQAAGVKVDPEVIEDGEDEEEET